MADLLFTHGPGNVDQLMASSLSVWAQNTPVDQVFNKRPFMKKMMSKAKRKTGGASIIVPIRTEKNTTAQAYAGSDILDTTEQNGYTDTQAQWKQYAVSIVMNGRQRLQNMGNSKIFDLLTAKKDQAMESIQDKINDDVFASSVGTNNIESLVTMVDATSTIQDVNSTNNSFWQSTVTTGGSFATQGLSDMRTTWNTIEKLQPESNIDMILTTSTIHEYYEGSLTPQTRYQNQAVPDGGFSGLLFKNATVFFDAAATSGVMYMFSSDDLYMCVQSGAEFTTSEFVKPSDQDTMIAQIFFMGQLVTRARRKLGKITSITA